LINTAISNGWELPEDIDIEKDEPIDEPPDNSLPFEFLGYNQGKHYYKPKASSQVIELSTSAHTKLGLMSLTSSMEFWQNRFTINQKLEWDEAICWMFNQSHKKGVFDPERVRGRGAWLDASRVIFHLGERMLVDNKERKVSDGISSHYIYQHGKPLLGPSTAPMQDTKAESILKLAKQFNWTDPTSAYFLCGWLALAPVCGGLKWRPHIWVTGGKGTGKTTILTSFMKPLLGQIYRSATGGTTEPGLRAALRSDAIPVLFDEFEQNDAQDKQNMQNVLSMARVASSEGGKIIKGSAGGGEANQYEIRSMFCVSSINVGLVQGADKDRFCLLNLERGKNDWLQIESEIVELCTEENGRDLVARTLNRLPAIRENARTFAKILAKKNGQRYGDQHGTLVAGAWSLEPESDRVLTEEEAHKYCDEIGCFDPLKDKDTREADEESCLALILESMISVEGGRRMTVLNLIESLYRPTAGKIDGCDETADQILGRYGLKCTTSHLAVANQNTNLEKLISNSPWASGSHKIALKRIKGAESSSTTLHFPGSKKSRATLLPLAALDDVLAVS
jgi:putative DNA primase/helicase